MEWGALCSVVLMEAMFLGRIRDDASRDRGQKGRDNFDLLVVYSENK